MNTIIRTKWGQISIDPSSIYEINTHINPWNNTYRIEFILEGSYQRIPMEFSTMRELMNTLSSISSDLERVKEYKYMDSSGMLQIDEKRRLNVLKGQK